jgi:ribA/ribD-fused uncharacterized protein
MIDIFSRSRIEMAEDLEREGEDEVPAPAPAPAPAVQADEELQVLGTVPLLPEAPTVVKGEKEGEAKAPEEEKAEAKAEAEAPETEESKAAKALRRAYLKQVTAFYKERNIYFQGKRNVSDTGKAEFKAQSRAGLQDSPLATITKNGTFILRKKEDSKKEAGKIIYKVLHQISVPSYRDPTQEEHAAIEKRRIAAIKTAEEAFEIARDSLRTLYKMDTTFEQIKEAMRLVREADLKLQSARFAETELTPYTIPLALLTLEKQDSGIAIAGGFAGTPMTLQQRYAVEEVGGIAEEEPKLGERTPTVILVSFAEEDEDHGFMSSWYKKEFVFDTRSYSCAFQAIMSEMARAFGNAEEADRIMSEEDPNEMVLLWDKVEVGEGKEPITEETWNTQLAEIIEKVNMEKFKNAKMAQLLAATGTKKIGYIPPENDKDMFQGTGLPFDDEKAYQPPAWIGKNIYGNVLEKVRIKAIKAIKKSEAKKTKSAPVVPATKLAINTAPVAAAPAPIAEEGAEEP